VRGLSFIVAGELFTVDVTLVQMVARKLAVTPVPSAPDEVIGVANLKGRVVTILSLSELLDSVERIDEGRILNAIIFKSSSSSEDQMGLAVEKPGNLIDIDDSVIRPPPLTGGVSEGFCISGIAEADDKIYRIIDLDSIKRKYTASREDITANTLFGGMDNDIS